jgi:hypothetical protein
LLIFRNCTCHILKTKLIEKKVLIYHSPLRRIRL